MAEEVDNQQYSGLSVLSEADIYVGSVRMDWNYTVTETSPMLLQPQFDKSIVPPVSEIKRAFIYDPNGTLLENTHKFLDLAGFIPGVGVLPDLANAGIYLLEGEYKEAGLSAVVAIPGLGDAFAVARLGSKAGKVVEGLSKAEEAIATTGKNIQKIPADKVNLTYPKNYELPYKLGTMTTEFTTSSEKNFVRVHGPNNRERAWVMEKREIEGLTPEQIKDKFALPEIPTHITDVKVPEGTRMRMGIAERNKFGSGEGIQYELLDVLDGPEFWQNTRKLGE